MKKLATDEQIESAMAEFKGKMATTLEKKGWNSYFNLNEVLGILEEEYLELAEAVRSNDHEQLSIELLDIAVGAAFECANRRGAQPYGERRPVLQENLDKIYEKLTGSLKKEKLLVSSHQMLGGAKRCIAPLCAIPSPNYADIAIICERLALMMLVGLISIRSNNLEW